MTFHIIAAEENPCVPSPCGPNSQCKVVNQQPVCSCLPNYVGNPPGCRPECTVSTECPSNKACINQKCADPCPGSCGINADCAVINHSPVCSCRRGNTGDPFTRCFPIPRKLPLTPYANYFIYFELFAAPQITTVVETNPCQPSPCGPNSLCRNIVGSPSCTCLPDFIGSPPSCRPECTINSECLSNLACIRQKCGDPCPGSCGLGAICNVINHTPVCTCLDGFSGDPFTQCVLKPPEPQRKKFLSALLKQLQTTNFVFIRS